MIHIRHRLITLLMALTITGALAGGGAALASAASSSSTSNTTTTTTAPSTTSSHSATSGSRGTHAMTGSSHNCPNM